MSGAASVNIKEVDLSTRVASFEGVFGAIVIEATKGSTSEPGFVTSDTQFLNNYTPNGRVEVGYDLAYFSALAFLERANKLWVMRAANTAYFGGAVFVEKDSSNENASLPNGTNLADPDAYAFAADEAFLIYSANEGDWANDVSIQITTITENPDLLEPNSFQIDVFLGENLATPVESFLCSRVLGQLDGAGRNLFIEDVLTASAYIRARNNPVIDGTTLPKGIVAAISQVESWDFSGLTGADYDVNGAGLLLNLASQSAYIWLNVTDGANTQTDPAGTGTGVQVDILSADTATDIAAKIDAQLVIEALANVDSIANATGVLTVTYTAGAQTANGDAGTSASAFTVDTAGVAAIEIIALNDGDDGLAISDANAITAANEFANKAKLNVTLLMDGGRTTPAYQKALDTIAQSRQDCVAILSIPFSDENASDYITAILEYQNDELNLNSSYSAIYSPHLLISDRFNAREIFVSPDGYVAGSISLSSINFEIWFPAAGFKRGILNVLDTKRRYTDGELDILYDNNINPIRFFPGRGIVVWGQKTLQRRASALDRLNVRLLLIVIEPAIKEFLENFLFDLNEVGVRTIIESQLEDYLETIRARKGITDYDVVVDDTNNSAADVDANRLNVDIFIKPTRSIEEIPVRIVITPTGISFGDAAGAI